ncbi:MATE family efflux transporter [Humibacillus xanthopallidus]|uniref:Putative MATE family efflux protein n=1 Tax=Humibacillus xanthopallidus TaxID=412689 RepID=A0A543HA04_9MICO|nr:MATE family efflux transporter [Humibacillus xanthopallidus]TQM55177.1 putative MATE family efflux protein [Humibacillus xanthopallidus]
MSADPGSREQREHQEQEETELDEWGRAVARRREILRLAVPAFLALIAEPLFLLADSAIIGHLGTAELAGLGVASAALVTGAGIFVFLAYGTTSVVARHLGAGDERSAISAGIDGFWLALGLGAVVAAVVAIWAEPICAAFGASPSVLEQATTYLRVSAFGLPGMLVILAVTGVLRGLQDTITPLVASVAGFGVNIALNLYFVYGLHWGIAGSAWGTVIAQTGMAVALVTVLVVKARARQASLHPHPGRVLTAARTGIPLLVRTLALRAVLLLTTWVAASLGDVTLAAHQVAMTIWSFLAFALDALAIAAQAIVGRALGAGDRPGVREAMGTMTRWGTWGGLGIGLVVVALHGVIPPLFSPDPAVQEALSAALVVVGLGQAVSGYVFVLDGVLIGAGDGTWLAWGMLVTLVAYLPILLAVRAAGPSGSPAHDVAILWVAFTGFMAIRAVVLGWRARHDDWMVVGAR